MGISIDPTPPEPDSSGVAKPAFETVGRLLAGIVGVAADGVPDAAGNFAGAAESGFEAIKAWRAVAETPEHRAWSLWQESLALTMVRFFETAMLTRNPDDEELAALLDEIIEDSRALCASPKTQVIQGHFRTPTEFPLYPALRDKLPAYAKRIAPDHVRDDEWLCLRLDRAFERGFQRVLFDEKDYYKPLLDAFDGQAATTANQRDQWERYYRWLWLDVSDRPLFGQQDGGASLADIFQPLRSAWREQGKASGPDEDAGREPDIIHIGWLDEQLEDWLRAGRTDDALRVVSGGPGSGKSSSASMFARKVAFEGRCNVFLIPVGGLNVERPIDEIVKDFVTKTRGRVGALGGNPLDWLETDPLPLLLIFDGLDEVARDDGAGLEVTQRFLNALRDRLGFANGGSKKARLMALALGRPQATEDSILKVGGLKDQVLLHAMPLSPFDETRFGNGGSRQVRLDDPGELRQQDHRENFWRRYRYFDRDCKEERPPKALARPDLAAMTSEPLLLYLLFFSGMDWSQAGANRNGIYEAIFQKIHKRDLEKPQGHKAKVGLESEQDFLALMECLGLAAWLGGGRTGTDEDFEIIRDRVYLTKYSGHFKDKKGAKLRNVAVQTFTHRGDGDEPGYAFIHKSFGEYLTAIALIKASRKWLRRHEGEPEAFAKDWLQLVGSERLTTDILRFIIDEAELRAEGAEPAGLVKDLAGIASHTLAYGFPAHADLLTHRGNADWRRREIFQRNAELALYAVIHAWAEVAYPRELAGKDSAEGEWEAGSVEIAWPELATSPAAAMIDRVRAQRRDDSLAGKLFARWNFGEAQRFGMMDLRGFELYGAKLSRAELSGANLIEAELSGADLRGADLRGAKLSRAELSGADLSGAKLSGADLREAKLSRAELSGADLREADCSRMRIDSARLQSANLSDAVNLTQEQIDKALGNSETKLPDGMRTPEAWLRDD